MASAPWLRLLRSLNLNHLLTFVVVADTRSFRLAAARMHISQSAISVQIRQLEQRLGVSLFHRTTRSVQLSDQGKRLFAVAKRVSEDIYQVAVGLRDEADLQRGQVVMAVLPSLAATVLPHVLREFAVLHPRLEIRLRDIDSKRALELIREGDADIGLLSRTEQGQDLRFTTLFRDDFVAVIPARGHGLSARSTVGAKVLATCSLVLNPRGVDSRETLETIFRAQGITLQPRQEVIGAHALVALVAAGFGVGILPRLALVGIDMSGCKTLELREGADREIGVVVAANRSESPATKALRQFLESRGPLYRSMQHPRRRRPFDR